MEVRTAPGFDTYHGRDVSAVLAPKPDWLPEDLRGFNAVRLSQSFVTSFRHCPRSAVADHERPCYGEAAAIGIAAHAVVETRIEADGAYDDNDHAALRLTLDGLAVHGWLPSDPVAFTAAALKKAQALTDVYLARYHRFRPNLETEVHGSIVWDLSEENAEVDFIIFTGCADLIYLDGHDRVGVDWKTGDMFPQPWEVQRYGVQWRAYAVMFGLSRMVFEYPVALAKGNSTAARYDGVLECPNPKEDPPLVDADREAFSWQLREECRPIAESLLASTDPWRHSATPTGWWCGASWCQLFAQHQCVGQHSHIPWIATSHNKASTNAGAIRVNRVPPKPVPVGIRDAGEQF